jgi:hypothetical protein
MQQVWRSCTSSATQVQQQYHVDTQHALLLLCKLMDM